MTVNRTLRVMVCAGAACSVDYYLRDAAPKSFCESTGRALPIGRHASDWVFPYWRPGG